MDNFKVRVNKRLSFAINILIVFLIILGSATAYSSGVWHFNIDAKRAFLFEILSSLKPIIENIVLLILADRVLKKVNFNKIRDVWLQIVFYSLFFSLLVWGMIAVRFNTFDIFRSSFPILFQTNKLATAALTVCVGAFLLRKINIEKIKLRYLIYAFLVLSVMPTILWITKLSGDASFSFGTMLWGIFLLLATKYLNQISAENKVKYAKRFLGIFAGSGLVLTLLLNLVGPHNIIFNNGDIAINRLSFLMTNSWAFFIGLSVFILLKQQNITNYISWDLVFGASLFSTHFLFIKPFWRNMWGTVYWMQQTPLHLIGAILISAVVTTLIAILIEILRGNFKHQVLAFSPKKTVAMVIALALSIFANVIMLISNSSFSVRSAVAVVRYKPQLMLLNMLMIFAFIMIIFALINRLVISITAFSVVLLVFVFANYQKILSRDEPILPVDISSNLKNIKEITSLVNVWLVAAVAAILVILVLLGVYLERRAKFVPIFSWKQRLLLLVSGVAFLGFFMIKLPLMPSSVVTWKTEDHTIFNDVMANQFKYKAHPGSIKGDFRSNGPVVTLVSRMIIPIMEQPSGYSKAAIMQLSQKLEKEAKSINKDRQNDISKQTVVYILSESFSNPQRVPGVQMNDPIPNTDQLKKTTTSGLMDSYGYGGGTADMEYEALTSMSLNNFAPALSTPYVELMPKIKYQPSVLDLFKTKNAIHPFQPTYYNRINAFKQLGFQKFYNTYAPDQVKYKEAIGGVESSGDSIASGSKYISDKSAYEELKLIMDQHQGGQFIQLSTMQNHMPYFKDKYGKENNFPASGSLSDASLDRLRTYAYGINQTDQDLKELIKQVDSEKRDVTLVFYGDHLPGLYEWQKDSDQKLVQYDSEIHQTDYFIYSNHSKRKVKKAVAAPYMFTPMMLEQTNSKVSPYYALLTKCMEQLPAGERDKYMLDNGKQVSEKDLTAKQKELLNEYKLIQYDITAGKHYLGENSSFFKV
ncbi:LTA synthase family protein [Pediococcus stilesii]|uniref:LTA synthase family protein n=1 Tax=Pediococcus stilesii TaxID=331679 RepID=UPI00070BE301|nr:LTA synthase family protein [Pediococcus stilesii]